MNVSENVSNTYWRDQRYADIYLGKACELELIGKWYPSLPYHNHSCQKPGWTNLMKLYIPKIFYIWSQLPEELIRNAFLRENDNEKKTHAVSMQSKFRIVACQEYEWLYVLKWYRYFFRVEHFYACCFKLLFHW